jgi:hypothetical protein
MMRPRTVFQSAAYLLCLLCLVSGCAFLLGDNRAPVKIDSGHIDPGRDCIIVGRVHVVGTGGSGSGQPLPCGAVWLQKIADGKRVSLDYFSWWDCRRESGDGCPMYRQVTPGHYTLEVCNDTQVLAFDVPESSIVYIGTITTYVKCEGCGHIDNSYGASTRNMLSVRPDGWYYEKTDRVNEYESEMALFGRMYPSVLEMYAGRVITEPSLLLFP